MTCKEIRNASAHSNCILNDLKARTAAHKTNTAVTNELMMIHDMNSNFRKNRMSNARIQQLVTLLYMQKTMVESDGIIRSESEELQKIMKRIARNYGYYSTNFMIKGTFDFLKLVVDNWFKTDIAHRKSLTFAERHCENDVSSVFLFAINKKE